MDFQKYISSGETTNITVTKAVASGDLYTAGSINGMIVNDAANGESVTIALRGIYNFKKTNAAIALGAMVAADGTDATKVVTTTDATKQIGICVEAVTQAETHAKIWLG